MVKGDLKELLGVTRHNMSTDAPANKSPKRAN